MRKHIKHMGVVAVLVLVLSFTAQAQNNSVVIKMTNTSSYQPAEIVVKNGEKITWKNMSNQIQTITVKTKLKADDPAAFHPDEAEPFSSGAVLPGESFSYTFFIPGSYEFVSLPNEKKGMLGKIIVKE